MIEGKILTIGIGGAAGEGVKKAGIKIGDFLRGKGYEVYISFDYPSLIRGGHNFVRLTAGKEKIWNDHSKLDILIGSNEGHADLHKGELVDGGKIITDLPLEKISENPEIIFAGEKLEGGEAKQNTELMDGNTAFAKGLEAAGLDFYVSYPMTPATSILHYLASRQKKWGLKVIQPENEIAAINMALGMAYTGKKAAVGSATGGFALMQEAFSFAGIAELPIVVGISQRQAPATGVPTRSSQADLRFAIHAGHGEFPRIVLAPGDAEEAFYAGAEALSLAWKFRVPVIVLLDKILSEHMMTANMERWTHPSLKATAGKEDLKIPGTEGEVAKVTSYEHDEEGYTIDRPEEVKKMVEKRFEKAAEIREYLKNSESVKIFGDKESDAAIVFWGSTKGAVLEAAKNLGNSVKLVQIVCMEPFPAEMVAQELSGKKIICVEGNRDGQLASLIREKTGIEIKEKILKYDSMPFDPAELAEEINTIWN